MSRFAAVDLGASSGRVMVWDGRALTEAHRFPNGPVRTPGGLRWDVHGLYREVLHGLRRAGPVASIGVDSWAVDYGLLDSSGALLGDPVHYRDERTDGVAERVAAEIGAQALYDVAGLQVLPFNTVYQLLADDLDRAATMLLVPDLLAYRLTGEIGAEVTNASTTGLLDVRTRSWASGLIDRLGLPARIFPPLRRPGDPIGPLLPEVSAEIGHTCRVTAVASHDTASAVAAVPASGPRFAYVSCGTWSLAGVELSAPVLTEAGRAANFTNEAGIDGTVRYLRNVMGLWLLSESLRTWPGAGLGGLLEAAEHERPFAALVDPDAPVFLPPGDMPARIAAECRRTGQEPPSSPPAFVRCILESLALGHRRAIRQAVALSGRDVEVVHLVGGGSRNALLCRLTADACGLPVVAGPAEATALGNVLVQARAAGEVAGLAEMRALAAQVEPLRRYEPSGDASAWDEAEARLGAARQTA
ncbi:rhamnulokinase [Planomonospora parontospora]|uniref:rhamnulokinase n=1 Tax=Planomonospora parontospora TaxID=58119 RepID=UPI001670DE1A|nr:rhamnulokinase family protein [Planomonospora parontospora]GGL13062.1 carbohydrate kinase [Planomonospora parontospora subsp. antibiotica]GII13965.1 carbohydrate kinase [Planomonospora parontospora subsp. antibiotica]